MIGWDKNTAVNPFNPFLNIWMSLTRRTTEGVVVYPEEKITREEALKMYTVWAAWQEFGESKKGTLEKGKLADLVVIDRDYMTVPIEGIAKIEPLVTIIAGKAVYTAPGVKGAWK
jgi:predicted amidohydrolase YtcJ